MNNADFLLKRILILTSGQGSDVAARNLTEALQRLEPSQLQVTVLDLLSGRVGTLRERLRHSFQTGPLILREAMRDALGTTAADLVVYTHPAYGALLTELERQGRVRDFALVALVMEAGRADWAGSPGDFFLEPSEMAARQLKGVPAQRVRALGFPVAGPVAARPDSSGWRVLYLVNSGRRKAPKLLSRLLAHAKWEITLVTEDVDLARWARRQASAARLAIKEDFERLPELLLRHDVVISRAETMLLHEAAVARCPAVAFRADSDQERANVLDVPKYNLGTRWPNHPSTREERPPSPFLSL